MMDLKDPQRKNDTVNDAPEKSASTIVSLQEILGGTDLDSENTRIVLERAEKFLEAKNKKPNITFKRRVPRIPSFSKRYLDRLNSKTQK
jgi:hypothetical protein